MNQSYPKAAGRDPRLDVLRGLALVMIFINHVPGNAYEHLTSRNFGFSDAAEAFVLMSGIATGLAYSAGFSRLPFAEATLRVWRRARKLYFVHLLAIALAVLIIAAGFHGFGTEELAKGLNFLPFAQEPAAATIGTVTLGHQLGYFNILPLYVVLLLAAPALIVIGQRSLAAMVGVSMLIWVLAGTFRLNLPNYPNAGGWFFNPLAWQFLFVIGLAAGMALKRGQTPAPYRGWLFGLALAYLAFSLVWTWLRLGGLPGGAHVPFFIGSFDKSFLPLPRLLHILALAYVIANLDWVARLCRSWAVAPLDLFGRNSLPVFAAGSVIAVAFQVYRDVVPTGMAADSALLACGLLLQYWVALKAAGTPPAKPWVELGPEPARQFRPLPPQQFIGPRKAARATVPAMAKPPVSARTPVSTQ